jgi:hypothetical protein
MLERALSFVSLLTVRNRITAPSMERNDGRRTTDNGPRARVALLAVLCLAAPCLAAGPVEKDDADCSSYTVSMGDDPELVVANALGELRVRLRGKRVVAHVDGVAVPESRIVRSGAMVSIVDDAGTTLFMFAAFSKTRAGAQLVYSPDFDPNTLSRLGIKTDSVGDALATQLGVDPMRTLLVKETCATSALKPYDVIVGVNGGDPVVLGGLERALARTRMGESLRLDVIRNGRREHLAVAVTKDRDWPESTHLEQHYRGFLERLQKYGEK